MQHYKMLSVRALALLVSLFCISTSTAQQTWYVNVAATAGGNGLGWATAFRDLHQALNLAQPGDQVWVAQGTYKPDTASDRNRYFDLPSGVKLYGSFAGWENTPAQRDIQATPTIISGNIGNPTDTTDNSYTLLYLAYPDANTIINGFIFERGWARGTNSANVPQRLGGAVYILGNNGIAVPTFEYCTFRHNAAVGGGAVGFHANLSPLHCMGVFRYCDFSFNWANTGGAIFMQGGSPADRGIEFENCRFYENNAFEGGAIYYAKTIGTEVLNFKNCVMDDNGANYHGGFMSLVPPDGVNWAYAMDSCDIARNVCLAGANVVQVRDAFAPVSRRVYIRNCKIRDHIFGDPNAGGGGGAKLFYSSEDYYFPPDLSDDTTHFTNNYCFNNRKGIASLGGSSSIGLGAELIIFTKNILEHNQFDVLGAIISATCEYSNNVFYKNEILSLYAQCKTSNNIFIKNKFLNGLNIYYPVTNFYYLNNVFIENSVDSISRDYKGDATLIAQNNIFIGNYNAQTGEPAIYLPTKVDTVILSNNFIDLPCPDNPPGTTPCSYAGSGPGAGPLGPVPPMVILASNNLTQLDPMLVDTAAFDFRLLPCSPLIDAGDNTYVSATVDFNNLPRIRNGTADIGAYEHQGPALAAAPETSPSCPGGASGSITPQVTEACLPVSYAWQSGPAAGTALSGLPPGDYQFTITDAKGQTATFSATVPAGDAPALVPLATPLLCGDTTGGKATAALQPGTPPLQFLWAGGSTDSLRAGLAAGSYPVTVTDAKGCSAAGTVVVDKTGSLSVDIDVLEISCHGSADGAFTVLPADGKAPYNWLWDTGQTGPSIGPLGPGTYAGTLTDALGCAIQWVLPLSQPGALQFNALVTNASDSTAADGRIELVPSGGIAPYEIVWNTGAAGPLLDSLPPGLYTATLTDAQGCELVESFAVGVTSSAGAASAVPGFALFPNPANDWVWLRLERPARAGLRVRVLDLAGREALDLPLPAGVGLVPVSVSGLPAGVYAVWLGGRVEKLVLR